MVTETLSRLDTDRQERLLLRVFTTSFSIFGKSEQQLDIATQSENIAQ